MGTKSIRTYVTGSSTIRQLDYDPDKKDLAVTFHSGDTYTYHDVDHMSYELLANAGSVGKHFAAHIKKHHKFTKHDK